MMFTQKVIYETVHQEILYYAKSLSNPEIKKLICKTLGINNINSVLNENSVS